MKWILVLVALFLGACYDRQGDLRAVRGLMGADAPCVDGRLPREWVCRVGTVTYDCKVTGVGEYPHAACTALGPVAPATPEQP
jgi:hypothetical protein